MKHKFSIGLTGGIGSGKSAVSQILREQGITVIDADQISRQLTAPGGAAIAAIAAEFGAQFISTDQALNRAAMRDLVFNDDDAKRRLEAIIHPLIRAHMQTLHVQAPSPYVVYDIPLLIEGIEKWGQQLQRICVILCDRQTQIDRVSKRNALSVSQIQKIIDSQASEQERLAHADDIIKNGANISLPTLKEQVLALHHQWLALANRSPDIHD
ncbi:dephospho-CoA kinase [Brackiella oedipodis]|uniref:dephospho-CoA kinase n=1 Tax=Brackiella oedipodis TaxID=124225 RepID=UPI00048DD203|nr:dephospho-CoA kinase [Brackiella oedipodis]